MEAVQESALTVTLGVCPANHVRMVRMLRSEGEKVQCGAAAVGEKRCRLVISKFYSFTLPKNPST